MNVCTHNAALLLERPLERKLPPDLQWNTYIRSVRKADGKAIGFLYCWKSTCCALYLQEDVQTQSILRGLVGNELLSILQPLSTDITNLLMFCRYFHCVCSDELHSFVSPVQTLTILFRLIIVAFNPKGFSLQYSLILLLVWRHPIDAASIRFSSRSWRKRLAESRSRNCHGKKALTMKSKLREGKRIQLIYFW